MCVGTLLAATHETARAANATADVTDARLLDAPGDGSD